MATGVPSELNSLKTLAGPTGFEPATSCVTGRRSNQTELRPRIQSQRYREKTLLVAAKPAESPNTKLSRADC